MRNILLAALAALTLAFAATTPATAGSRYHDSGGDQALEFFQGFLNGLAKPSGRYYPDDYYYDDNNDYYDRQYRNNRKQSYKNRLREYREVCRLERQMLEEGIDFEPRCRFRNQ